MSCEASHLIEDKGLKNPVLPWASMGTATVRFHGVKREK